jgi:putative membrane protein
MTVSDLPALNACLNGTSAILLTIGYIQIRKQRQIAHRNCMIGAFVVSTVFLCSYVYYHTHTGHTTFVEPAWFKKYYLVLLVSHVLLAFVIVPLILVTLFLAWKKRFESHRRIARWTWPAWMYVSVTGVVIYLILYQIFPQAK